jgi:ketosteroid isomerase-like protein
VINGFLAMNGEFRMEPAKIVEARDLALLMARWTLDGTSPDGQPVEIAGHTSDVVRRQPDGSWLFVIDNPFGTAELV